MNYAVVQDIKRNKRNTDYFLDLINEIQTGIYK